MKSKYTIFYSWQSDLKKETNQNAIRQEIRRASSKIEDDLVDTTIVIDEATRETSGSPNIPQTIFNKIDDCDIFICDLTTINSHCSEKDRKVQNPNVLIELGYAIATVGWERIILLFNKHYGNFPNDLPFDIDRHRSTPFKITGKDDKSGKNEFFSLLTQAFKAIIDKDPLKPHESKKITPEEKKRELDIKNLQKIFETIHIPTFDHFIEEFPQRILKDIYYYKEYFIGTIENSSFFIYNEEVSSKITTFKNNWIKSLSFAQHYGGYDSENYYHYYIPADLFPNQESERDFFFLAKHRDLLNDSFRVLLNYIRLNYLEIDIEKASKKAYETVNEK
jgi:hypothetical protein